MFTTLPSYRIPLPRRARLEGESHWASMMLPPDSGIFLVDLDWSENTKRTQPMLCPATVAAVAGIHVHEAAVLDVMYIPAPRHDGAGREPVLRINAVDAARDPARRFAQILLVRTLDGRWHACEPEVNFDALEDRVEMLRVEAVA
jgi:hypothetical protein